VEQLQKHVTHRDDHIRLIEAWWEQVLQELELLVDPVLPAPTGPNGQSGPVLISACFSNLPSEPPYITGTGFKDTPSFQDHLNDKTEAFRKRAEAIITRIASSRGEITPNIADLETRVNSLLQQQKDYVLQLDRAHRENEQLTEDLNKKTLQCIKLERRQLRLKSAQVATLEQQFVANATKKPAAGENGAEGAVANGDTAEISLKLEEALAVAAKQKEHIEKAQAEAQTLQEENLALKVKREEMTDEEYIRTDVFKQFKSLNEDLIKQVNHLEAANKLLREESEKLQAERTAFRTKLNEEAQHHIADLERQLEERDADVTRIRGGRDEWFAKASVLESSQKEEKNALQQIKELAAAREDRIVALELEMQRLKPAEDQPMAGADSDVDNLEAHELLAKYKKLQQDFESINKELPALQQAYKRSMGLAQKKVMDFTALEDRAALLLAEKQKADQKYFAVRKDADLRDRELGALRSQNRKSSEIVAQLKEVESQHRVLISNLEKQLADLRQANAIITAEHKKTESQTGEVSRQIDALKNQQKVLATTCKTQSAEMSTLKERSNEQELEVARLTAKMDKMQKEKDDWKRKALNNSSEEEEMLRVSRGAFCSVATMMLTPHSNMRSVPSAATTSRTRSSRRVATSSAAPASTIASATACASAPTAPRRSTAWTLCWSITERALLLLSRMAGRPRVRSGAARPLFLACNTHARCSDSCGFARLGSLSGMIPLVL
jgi:E3 ubiquitin-protein ligase BRE1